MEVQVKKNRIILPMVIVLLSVLASVSHASCVASGEISRVSVNPGTVVSSFYVITSTPQQPSFLYGTTDGKVINAALAAQASHMTVQVTGSATTCGTVKAGAFNGGTVVSFTTAP
jgi:hypothetical protein